jgi:valyl-tRNA synthetase
MKLSKRYNPRTAEPRIQAFWEQSGVYRFSTEGQGQVYSIDTPPATVSGNLHLGHCYSYSQPDFMARFWRMNGYNVYYPMGYDDNGLPTGRYVERRTGASAAEIGRQAFVAQCLAMGEEMGKEYEALWRRLGLSVDWRYTYRTIDEPSVRIAQRSFLDLYEKKLIYRRKAPSIWCPECGTAIAQADLEDLERKSTFYTLAFQLKNGGPLPIATTRPELLPACVAVFVHPEDERFRLLEGQQVSVPLFGQSVPLLTDPSADPDKGTGVVMCCTFGDVTDVHWWYTHRLPLIKAIDRQGCLTHEAGEYAGLTVHGARRQIVEALEKHDLLLGQRAIAQSVRIHERCDTAVEYIVTPQWFTRVLDFREELVALGEQITWHPPHMKARYRQWVENLGWDWCLSRQRAFGVPFPVWYCRECGEIVLADRDALPVDPTQRTPTQACPCGCNDLIPEKDVMDTWATSSLTPQIAGRWLADPTLYERLFPMALRAQAHEIIRTWAFYTIVKSFHHFGTLPWQEVAISGWGIAGEGMGKISKSRGGGPMTPVEMIEKYSADAVRYWAASTAFGKDAVISEEKIQTGYKLVNKLWNVARFSQRFLLTYAPPGKDSNLPRLSPADRWILSRTQRLVRRTTELMRNYDYAAAKSETESFFWTELADNYLEMAKLRLYDEMCATGEGARYALYHTLLATLKLFAPFVPHVTEQIYQGVFAEKEKRRSIHIAHWPVADPRFQDDEVETIGEILTAITTAVRRYKSEHSLSLGSELKQLQLATDDPALIVALWEAEDDLTSVTRAQTIRIGERLDDKLEVLPDAGPVAIALAR